MIVFTTGNGVSGFTFDSSLGVFYLSHPNIRILEEGVFTLLMKEIMFIFQKELSSILSIVRRKKKIAPIPLAISEVW